MFTIDQSALETTDAHPLRPQHQLAERIVETIHKSKRIIVVTGAGISVSGGIPDFRSFDGLYNLVKSRYPETFVKGKDLFDASLFKNEDTTKVFYSFMSELKQVVNKASATRTHEFIKRLQDSNKLLRCYTQNIDCLEERIGMSCELYSPKSEVILLHGSLSHVVCTVCKTRSDFSGDHIRLFSAGDPPPCEVCTEKSELRIAQNKRRLPIGFLRPDIILYNEHHTAGDWVSEILGKDLSRRPDMLIVMGTSLKVSGIKKLVRDIAKSIHVTQPSERISTVLINKTDLPIGEWKSVFDARWIGSADSVVEFIENGLKIRERAKKVRMPKSISLTAEPGQRRLTENFVVVKKSQSAASVKSIDSLDIPENEVQKENGNIGKTIPKKAGAGPTGKNAKSKKSQVVAADIIHYQKVSSVAGTSKKPSMVIKTTAGSSCSTKAAAKAK